MCWVLGVLREIFPWLDVGRIVAETHTWIET